MQSTLLGDRKWHFVSNELNWVISHIFAAVRCWWQRAGQEASLLLTKRCKCMSSAVPFVYISWERSNNKQHKVKTINRIWKCNFAQNMKQELCIILLRISHLDNQAILLKMKGRWKEDRKRRKMMICKRWMRRREIYLQRNDNRKGLAKHERDLWAEGSVAAELFVSEFFASRQIASSTSSAQPNYAPWKYGSQK